MISKITQLKNGLIVYQNDDKTLNFVQLSENSYEISEKIFHFQTRQLWDTILTDFVKYGEETTINRIKKGVYEAIYNTITIEDGKFIIYDLDRYNEIIAKYYTKEDN